MGLLDKHSDQTEAYGQFMRAQMVDHIRDQRGIGRFILNRDPTIEAVRIYWWMDGIDVPRTKPEHDMFKQLCAIRPNSTAAEESDRLWEEANQSMQNAPRIDVLEPNTSQQTDDVQEGRRRIGNRYHGEQARPSYRVGRFTPLPFDEARLLPHPRLMQGETVFPSVRTLETVSRHTENLHEFIHANRLLCGLSRSSVDDAIGRQKQSIEYELRGQHPPKDVVERLQTLMFDDSPEGEAKKQRLQQLVIQDKAIAGKHSLNTAFAARELQNQFITQLEQLPAADANEPAAAPPAVPDTQREPYEVVNSIQIRPPQSRAEYERDIERLGRLYTRAYQSYVAFALEMPRDYWEDVLFKFNHPEEYERALNKPHWVDEMMQPLSQGDFVRVCRQLLNLTQEDLANRLNTTDGLIRQLELDHTARLTPEMRERLFDFFQHESEHYATRHSTTTGRTQHYPFFLIERATEFFDQIEADAFVEDERDIQAINDQHRAGLIDGDERGRRIQEIRQRRLGGGPEQPAPAEGLNIPPRMNDIQRRFGEDATNEALSTCKDPAGTLPRHRLFTTIPRPVSYDRLLESGIDNANQTARTIQRETLNIHEFCHISRVLRFPPNGGGRQHVSPDVSLNALKQMENGISIMKWPTAQILRDALFPIPAESPATDETNQALRDRFDELYIRGHAAQICHKYAEGDVKKIEEHFANMPPAYWQQTFLKFRAPEEWENQPSPPPWHDCVMDLTSAGMYMKAYRASLGWNQRTLADNNPVAYQSISQIENDSRQDETRIRRGNSRDPEKYQAFCDHIASGEGSDYYAPDKAKTLPMGRADVAPILPDTCRQVPRDGLGIG